MPIKPDELEGLNVMARTAFMREPDEPGNNHTTVSECGGDKIELRVVFDTAQQCAQKLRLLMEFAP